MGCLTVCLMGFSVLCHGVFEGFEWAVSCLRGLSGRCHCV